MAGHACGLQRARRRWTLALLAGLCWGSLAWGSGIGLGNTAPQAADDSYGAVTGQTLNVSEPGVLSNDTDADDDSLEAGLVSDVTSGTLSLNSDGSFSYTPADGFTGNVTFTYRASDGAATSGTATVTITVSQESNAPTAVLSVTPSSGFVPFTATLDGSGSSDPNGKAIVAYRWVFGNVPPQTTTTSSTTVTYTRSGNYNPSLIVVNSDGVQSLPATQPVRGGDFTVDDRALYGTKGSLKMSWSSHANGQNKDAFSLSGYLNPAGFPGDLSGMEMVLRLNGNAVTLAIGTSSPQTVIPGTFLAQVDAATGFFSITCTDADLRNALQLVDETIETTLRVRVFLTLNSTAVLFPISRSPLDFSYKSIAGKSAKGTYSFKTNGSVGGVFRSTKTIAAEQSGGGFALTAKGVLLGDLSTSPVLQAGSDLTLQFGDASGPVLTVPYSAFKISGSGTTSVFTYSASQQEVAGLKKLQINCKSRTFSLSTEELAGTGIPGSASSETSHQLPITVTIPTATGTFVFETTVELKRSAGSTSWSR